MTGTAIAFFDVDETLITVKSMFSFLEFALPAEHRAVEDELTALAAAGVPREETNRRYYRAYRGFSEAELAETGRRWFAERLAAGGLLHEPAVRELARLRAEGCAVALVSGSFRACLDPVAEHLGGAHVLCTTPEVVDGRYTGEVLSTAIGEGKAQAARDLMAHLGAAPEDCAAYGDHASDLPLLLAVGRPGIVGDDPVLTGHPAASGWRRLPGIGTPALTTSAFTTRGN
ncbi:HAD family hydrolase [Kitasatospora sp. NPDC092948]|uniref:HAD family hydrolase n=1 Tax=Kitasatospora sp. NPDC092948 TaxID=3364088 RepID=UPI00380B4A30